MAFLLAAPGEITPPNAARTTAAPWQDVEDELVMTAEGGIDVCEALSRLLSLVPGIGDAVGTVTEWLCLIPAAIAVDYVAVHHGGRDAFLGQGIVGRLRTTPAPHASLTSCAACRR